MIIWQSSDMLAPWVMYFVISEVGDVLNQEKLTLQSNTALLAMEGGKKNLVTVFNSCNRESHPSE